jgi:drug/metabolite transporter (DMT)-like permease
MTLPTQTTDASTVPRWTIDFVLLAAIWGSSFMFMKTAAVEFGPLPTAAARVAIAAAFLLPMLLLRGLGKALVTRWQTLLVVGMLNSGIPFACYAFALLYISSGLSAILNATVPLFGALIAWAWLKDTLTPWRIAGLFTGFAGVTVLTLSQTRPGSFAADGLHTLLAVLACLTATLCYGIAASFTKKYLQGLPSLLTATGSQLGATIGLAIPAALLWPHTTPSLNAWLALLVSGVLCTGVAYILYFRLIESAGPAKALTVTFLIPVFALGYGWTLLNEQVTVTMVVCGVVVMLGTAMSSGLLPRKR